ncbi:DUF3168 domain-containing protein [Streptomonospora litoralis]|uniref:Uncharacterized protein n=1 Tax=Streptomonospora litoralis TaxID=2498135 RepID=A0A4P6QAY9_9ACTN|nr:DUF3168 domain-containing protein [Streptomonospora litoralis]QBI56799.1 hypothetical protein EKD16_25290 [Streptomonospora litoralis]
MSFQETPVAESALGPLQVAIVARCEEHLDVAVWDYVPEDQPHPYVTVGEAFESPDNVHGRFGRRVRQTLHVWTRGRGGFAEANRITGDLVRLFDHQERHLVVAGHRVRSVRLATAQPMRDPDPLVRHVPLELVVHTEQQPP